MSEQIKIFETKDIKVRFVLLLLMLMAIAFGWFSIRWQLGNMFAALTQPNSPNSREIAELAADLSPRDPMTTWLKANVEKERFSTEALSKSVESLERAVKNAPFDYRYWVELARGYEQIQKFEQAEKAFQQAVKLAPNYAFPHWQLGNFYLRRGRETEAFAELRQAAEASSLYRDQVFGIAWEYFEKDTKKLEELAGDKPEVKAGLAKFFASKGQASEALRIWNTLSPEKKQKYIEIAKIITQALYEKGFYKSAVSFVHQLAIEPQAKFETVQNGGFESPIPEDAQKAYFNWKIVKLEKVDVKTDSLRKKEGNRSLRVNFNGYTGIEVKNIWQVVAVEGGNKYQLSFSVKTENLKSAGTPLFEIVNANDNKIIATGASFPTETNDWTNIKIDFTVPPNAEGILIRLDRAYCGDACPIFGTFWVDDFKLQRL